ncbi:hypothetical protein I350_02655 [Cryptococcus amylolentus CBS 6273]|uniref:DUF676 domain-containing protein n=1 Tax=Cryptococcus amylolentus CBS 6273 TaxID=1296118 RepID=A0A1E3K800_9TREE|nr:hypothetical protein I350_02655 [Cryptococcus amylolentus CBS 6273]
MPKDVHLVLLVHGLWGSPTHMAVAAHELEAAYRVTQASVSSVRSKSVSASGPEEDPVVTEKIEGGEQNEDLVIMIAGGMSAQLTYDGVDVCASRVAWEVDQKIQELEDEGCNVTKFSVTGYSLGGRACTAVVSRYLIGLLHSRSPPFFERHRPVSFATLSTPHYGVPRYNTFLSTTLCWLGARILSRSGEQLYVADRYSDEDPRPLLEIMADPRSVFYTGLEQFERRAIFAAAINDNSVPYPSASISPTDHFSQWAETGIQVDANEAGFIRRWWVEKEEAKGNQVVRTPGKKSKGRSLSDRIGVLPPVLRYRFPFNYIILLLFPIMLPIIILLILARQSLDTSRSRNRLQRLARASPTATPSAIPSSHGLSIQHLRELIRRVEHSLEADIIQSSSGPSLSPTEVKEMEAELRKVREVGDEGEASVQVILKESQARMCVWLNRLGLDKYLVWWPEISNAHATVVVRDLDIHPAHERGRGMLKFWAQVVLGQATEIV